MAEYLETSRSLGAELISIVLTCTEEENERRLLSRVGSPDQTTKLIDVDILRMIRATEGLFEFGADALLEIKVDVSGMTPAAVAESLAPRVRESLQGACMTLNAL